MVKTNALRILDAAGIKYTPREYDPDITDGESVAHTLGLDPDRTFKTLVTIGSDNEHYVFIVPVNFSLDMKKAASSVGVKRVEMIKQKELFPLTGYIHGGCSPIGMKKKFVTVLNDTATLFPTINVSGGRVGLQIEIAVDALIKAAEAIVDDIIA